MPTTIFEKIVYAAVVIAVLSGWFLPSRYLTARNFGLITIFIGGGPLLVSDSFVPFAVSVFMIVLGSIFLVIWLFQWQLGKRNIPNDAVSKDSSHGADDSPA
jgi:protein-S-isoprenylcysteine O-methyltransferase Ste14